MSSALRYSALIIWLGLPMQACVTFDDAPYEVTSDRTVELSPEVPEKPAPMVPEMPAPSTAPVCPSFCEAGCAGDECVIDCSAQDCRDTLFVCPEGVNCTLFCGQSSASCSQTTLRCEFGNDCAATCTTKDACEELLVVCNSGSCKLACEVDGSCKGGTLDCAVGADCSVDTCSDKDLPKCSEPADCLQDLACPMTEEEDE